MPHDFSFATPGHTLPPRQPKPGELLFEFYRARDHKFFRCELRDYGKWGVEAQFLDPIDLVMAQRFENIRDGDAEAHLEAKADRSQGLTADAARAKGLLYE